MKTNLIGKSTLEDFDERHFLDCIQINKYLPHKEKVVMFETHKIHVDKKY